MKNILIYITVVVFIISGGCAKENLPPQNNTKSSLSELYIVQSSLSPQVVVPHLIKQQSGVTDTTISLYSVALAGTTPANADIRLQPVVYTQVYVDSFNLKQNTNYRLLPATAYTIDPSIVITRGLYSSDISPIRLKVSQLQPNVDYLLPLSFEVVDGSYKKDGERDIANFAFRIANEKKGRIVGNIPEALFTNSKLFDFYEDLALKDPTGSVWVYPLGTNDYNKIGSRVILTPWFSAIYSLFFNPKFNSIMGTDATGTYIYSFQIYSKLPQPSISTNTSILMSWSTVFRSFIKDYHTAGQDGKIYGLYTTSGWPFVLSDVDPSPVSSSYAAVTNTVYSSFSSPKWWYANVDPMFPPYIWPPSAYRSFTVMGDYIITLRDNSLLAFKFREPQHINLEKNASGAPIEKALGILFSSYVRIFNINGKHLVGLKNNGDVVLFKDFSVNDFYEGTNLDK